MAKLQYTITPCTLIMINLKRMPWYWLENSLHVSLNETCWLHPKNFNRNMGFQIDPGTQLPTHSNNDDLKKKKGNRKEINGW
jgi:hypothetical protein